MTTPTPRPNTPGAARVPLPGQHLPGAAGHGELADPDKIRTEVRELLAELADRPAGGAPGGAYARTHQAPPPPIQEQAQEVLVQGLA
ncbi:hypothetical protein, partial [Nocardia carnea]|uniref:hypothetical protein n=1 Tax=Nocardia carnea TaxID=37328 RepID=UPI0024574ABB